jgi:hypothetical protein
LNLQSQSNDVGGRVFHSPIAYPPTNLRHSHAGVNAIKAAQQAALAELDTLFASLQQHAFHGEL